jgi:hypothetical protein
MLRLLFWTLVVAATILVLNGTLPVPGIAQEEVVYTATPPVSTCGPAGCVVVYTLDVANVGRSTQDGVRVRLRADAVQAPVIAPTVRRASEATLASPASDRAGVEAYPLGRIDTDERVTLVFALRAGSRETVLGWDRVLVGVDPTVGGARPGEVSAVTPGRVLHAVGRRATRLIEALRQAIAAS